MSLLQLLDESLDIGRNKFFRGLLLSLLLFEVLGTGKVGWHTFRHSYATILKSHGEDVKTVQELMRHANSSVTFNLYAQAITETRRAAQGKVARLVFQSAEGPSEKRNFLLDGIGRWQFCGICAKYLKRFGVTDGIRTRVTAVKEP